MRLLAITAVAAGVVLSGVWGDDGSGDAAAARGLTQAPTPTPTAAPAPPPAPRPIRLTIGVSGDLLPHLPVVARARALAGGRGYDFRPLLRPIRRWVRRNSLAFCHVETPLTPAAPAGYPRFNSPPALARAVKATGFDACSTASNHSLDRGQAGIDGDAAGARPRRRPPHRLVLLATAAAATAVAARPRRDRSPSSRTRR